jgi:hypothetical protein
VTLLIPNAAEALMLDNWMNKTAPQNGVLRLFTNNITPGEGDTEASYTEAAGFGYAALTLAGAGWTATPGAPTETVFAQQTFTFTGALGNVYGYYVTELGSGLLKWAERFAGAPFNIQNNGDQIKITPRFTLE